MTDGTARQRIWNSANQVFNPEGIVSISPGLRGTNYPGLKFGDGFNRNAVVANVAWNEWTSSRNRVAVVGFA